MSSAKATSFAWGYDFTASIAVFLVALPLCLGVASASGAPHLAGVIAGIVGGIVVGFLSGSHTSVSGPAAGLTAVVFAQISILGSFEVFLTALLIAGIIQSLFGVIKAGFIAEFFPSSVIKGLLTAIGIILILKQIPHLVGHDPDPEGDLSFFQADQQNTFTEIIDTIFDLQPGALIVGFVSLLALMAWDRVKLLKTSIVPGPLVIVVLGVALYHLLKALGGIWLIEPSHLVQVPEPKSWKETLGLLKFPDFSYLAVPKVYLAAGTIAIVASLETLLNLDAVDKIDPQQRRSPPSRELLAQGVGNFLCGLIGGIPVTSVIVRSTVNINAGAKSKLSAIIHGVHLLVFVVFLPSLINQIPLSCLAAILILTGFKLAHPKNFINMWKQGKYQFLPFITTVLAILFTDLLIGIVIGLIVSIGFILRSNLRRPLSKVLEKHISGDVLRIRLANQVSFLNKAALSHMLDTTPEVKHVLIDATDTDYIDPDILDLVDTYKNETGPARGVQVSVIGFRKQYEVDDRILFVDYTTREVRDKLTPDDVVEILKAGNKRFLSGDRINRDLLRQLSATAASQFPMAVILSCIDSRAPTEMIFDLGLGDVFTIRIAGNVAKDKVIGSMEYACVVSGAKLILVMGHTRCGAVTTAVDLGITGQTAEQVTGCKHIDALIKEIQVAIDPALQQRAKSWTADEKLACIDDVAKKNVIHTMQVLKDRSDALKKLVDEGRIKIVGCLYDIRTGTLEFL
jgi:carbonic anhydrase